MAYALIQVVNIIANILTLLIFADALMSFAPIDPYHPVRRLLRDLTDPIEAPIRRIMPPMGMIDLTPMITIFAIQILAQILATAIAVAFA